MFRKWMQSAGIAVLLVIAALALSQAGPLEPSAPPGPTMKTLDEIPPTWSQRIPVAQRFVVVLGTSAVLDKESGLVWERGPGADELDWGTAMQSCWTTSTGGRNGWRLPSFPELTSLSHGLLQLDESAPFDFDCADGRCVNVQTKYWTTSVNRRPEFLGTLFVTGFNGAYVPTADPTIPRPKWCVRGGSDAAQ